MEGAKRKPRGADILNGRANDCMAGLSRAAWPCQQPMSCHGGEGSQHSSSGGDGESLLGQVHLSSTFRLPGKCWLKGSWHSISICSHRGLGKSTSLKPFGDLTLVALNIYWVPAEQIPT